MSDTARAAEQAARGSYGRLLAILAARCRDIALAEDALGDAFARALTHWPKQGVPDNPDGWLFAVARNRILDAQRRAARHPEGAEMPEIETPERAAQLPDERLALMLVCTHPAIAPDLHAPMILQCVLGLHAHDIARLFSVSPAALAKRLVRAKTKLRAAGAAFSMPDPEALPTRADALFEAVYGLHAHDWLDPGEAQGEEALFLADLLARLLPANAEAHGLAALIAFGHARRDARVVDGELVPLERQDCARWDGWLTRYAQGQMSRAQTLAAPGRFQTEAAIQAVHMARAHSGRIDWAALNQLHFALNRMAPSAGGLVAQAVVTSHLHGAAAGLSALEAVEKTCGTGFQPLWASRADCLVRAGQPEAAIAAFDKAISLTTDGPSARFLRKRRADVLGQTSKRGG